MHLWPEVVMGLSCGTSIHLRFPDVVENPYRDEWLRCRSGSFLEGARGAIPIT